MSNLKFSPNLFLAEAELNRFNKFIGEDGFREFLIQNSNEYGLIRKENKLFSNGLVQEDVGLKLKINELKAINSDGNLIYQPALSQISVPDDSTWYWLKIAHTYTNNEIGVFSIDNFGNLVCTSNDAELLTILRGQSNYPSRVKFTNAVNNIYEYDVEEIIDNNNATLTGDFIAESNLKLAVVGTFTAGYSALTSEKLIFQYDYCALTLVSSNTAIPPISIEGQEFFIARVKNDGVNLYIEDKRDNNIWETNANYFLRNIEKSGNPLIGVEQITYDDSLSTKVQNIVQLAWAFTAINFTVNLKLNKITISAGSGGKFKSNNFYSVFNDGDFDGWRLYVSSGSYYKISSSLKVASTIELNLENLDGVDFFNNIDSTSSIVQSLIIAPDADEIEFICTPNPSSNNTIAIQVKKFNINNSNGKIALNVFAVTDTLYNIKYKYKHIKDYSATLVLPSDTVGFYNEDQFDENGQLLISPIRTAYTSSIDGGFIPLILNPGAYSNFIANNFLGDRLGVEVLALSNTTPLLNITVGSSRQYQYFEDKDASAISDEIILSQDLFINILKTDYVNKLCRNGNFFLFHFKQRIKLNGFKLKIVTDYTSNVANTTLKEFNVDDERFLQESEQGIFIRASFDGEDWILNNVNEVKATTKFIKSIEQYKTFLGGSVDPGININFTVYPNWDIIPACLIAIPNDTNVRTINISAKINFKVSNGVNNARADFRIINQTNNSQLDFVYFQQEKNIATDSMAGTIFLNHVGNFNPGDIILLQAIGYVSTGDINIHDIQFSAIEL